VPFFILGQRQDNAEGFLAVFAIEVIVGHGFSPSKESAYGCLQNIVPAPTVAPVSPLARLALWIAPLQKRGLLYFAILGNYCIRPCGHALSARATSGDDPYPSHLERLPAEEYNAARERFKLYQAEHIEISPVQRDASLAPSGSEWQMLIRQMNTIDRNLDRKVRPLMQLQRERKGGAQRAPRGPRRPRARHQNNLLDEGKMLATH
jgi:hypothetical protein